MLRTASAARGLLARPWAGAAARRPAAPRAAQLGWRWCSAEAWSDGGEEEASEEEAVGPLNADEEYMQLRALYIGQSIDVANLFRDCFHDTRHSLQRRNVVIHLDDVEEDSILEIRQWGGEAPEHKQRARQRFVVFHDYGCVVFFNVEEATQRRLLDRVMPYVTHVNDVPNDERYGISLLPSFPKWCEFADNYMIMRQLDLNSVRIVSSVLARSVALEHYEREADSMADQFRTVNAKVAVTGKLSMRGHNLFKVVALQNQIMSEITQRLNILDRSRPGDAAWEYENYERLWEGLSEEFMLRRRFDNMHYKIDLTMHSAKFFIEILSNRSAERQETAIILLISAELAITVVDHWPSFGSLLGLV